MAIHSSILAWRIPGPAEPGGLPSMESYRVGHDRSDLAAATVSKDLPQVKTQVKLQLIVQVTKHMEIKHIE